MSGRSTAEGPVVVDARGERCPEPVIRAARAAADAAPGTVLEVRADDPAAAADLPAWCRMRGHTYGGGRELGGGGTAYTITLG